MTERKSPPNPWPELRLLRSEREAILSAAARHRAEAQHLALRTEHTREIINASEALIDALDQRTFFNRNREAIDASRKRLRTAYDRLHNYDTLHAPKVPHGNIAGLSPISA